MTANPFAAVHDMRPRGGWALFVWLILLNANAGCGRTVDSSPTGGNASLQLPFYGTQFVPLAELPYVRSLGFNVVLNDFAYDADPAEWLAYLDAAAQLNLRVIAWLWPEGWTLDRRMGTWNIDAKARRFIQIVAAHPATLAVYGLHEPYWMDCDGCGYTTAEQQALYRAIKQIAPVAVYSEIDGFAFWAAKGEHSTIAPGVCDYCQTKFYPFLADGTYQRNEAIAHLEKEAAALRQYAPGARLVWTMPAFAYEADGLRMPTADEMWDYASLVYGRGEVFGAWWYPWRWENEVYSDDLARHPELHPMVRAIAERIVAAAR